mmetsp:Transcript_13027/g.17936  ORF Transcript_13027/g.17936 Transcript_13027/m.17936 type:complete len:382 (-) Transcript_13027:277-1422(-)|eukprot:CAMPEP_0185733866 /NCGR_PEP_ID=MMETSP1171-20130828/20781_1 /TAXON_ID=374046 /ORGANISM="Helicotheca tamensis, Strain CCMP826" /LENGTH=381 /DNA_ID=CAMNT_0028403699 /DNA_START=172 /DNA_END=1317 /DNA_ORIENTATION=+
MTSKKIKAEPSQRKTGYIFEERYMWHSPWIITNSPLIQPFTHWEHAETKRRFHNLLQVSNLYKHERFHHLTGFAPATDDQIELNHTKEYIKKVKHQSSSVAGGYCDDETTFSQYAHDIASLAIGGVIHAVDAVMDQKVDNAYALIRPPGHHATFNAGMGFCIFNNIAIATRHLLKKYPDQVRKIAIVDYDVHHGNGTQDSFWNDGCVLFISIHQDSNYPYNSGNIPDIGAGKGEGMTINIPLPPGSGKGAYDYVFKTVIIPSLKRFNPDFILVSSGFDASYADPLSAMLLSSCDFRNFTKALLTVAQDCCDGRIAFVHEGGYSEVYVPFCGIAVIEELMGIDEKDVVKDPFLQEVTNWGYQGLQSHQKDVVDQVADIHQLK